jgi:hypothetical protein
MIGLRAGSFRPVAALPVVFAVLAGSAHAQNDISKLIDQAKQDFRPVSDRQLDDARAELRKRMRDVEDFVEPSTANGKQWMRYLRWDALKQAVAEERPKSVEAFNETLHQLNRNEPGLESSRFRKLATALQRYRDLVAVASWDKPAEIYAKQLDALQRDLDAYRKEPSPRTETTLSERIRIIDSIGQAHRLVRTLRADLARPNAFVELSTDLIAASAGPVDRRDPVTDCILGTNVHSQAHTKGTVDVATIPSNDKAVVEFHSKGHTFSDNTGFNGPAVIRSTSDTNYTAKKRVELSDKAFVTKSASADATTDLHLHSVSKNGGGLGSRLVSSIGWRKAQQSRGQAESIAANHAETRIEDRFNEDLDDEVHKARKRYDDEYRRPLERRGEVPEHIRFSSDKDSVDFEVTQASRSQIGAPNAPPAATEKHDVTMRLHQSAVDNYTASVMGGATARQTKPDEDIKFDVPLPKFMKNMWKKRKTEATNTGAGKEEPFKQYSLTLRENRPISVGFATDTVKLTLHIVKLTSGDKTFENWDVTGTYKPELSDGRVTLHRQGDLVTLPADFRGQLNSRQVAERRNLEEELNKRSDQGRGFPKSIEFDPIKPEGKMADAGPLNFTQFTPGDGWLTIGLDRQKKSTRTALNDSVRKK